MKILVPMNDSSMSERALAHALEYHPGADITVLHVVGKPSPMLGTATGLALEDDFEEAAEEQAGAVFDRASEIAAEYDAEVTTEVQVGKPASAILNRADDFDALVVGSHSGSLADRLFVGDVAQRVFRQSPVPVTFVR